MPVSIIMQTPIISQPIKKTAQFLTIPRSTSITSSTCLSANAEVHELKFRIISHFFLVFITGNELLATSYKSVNHTPSPSKRYKVIRISRKTNRALGFYGQISFDSLNYRPLGRARKKCSVRQWEISSQRRRYEWSNFCTFELWMSGFSLNILR